MDDASKVKATLCKTMEAASSVASGYTSVSGGISAGVPMGAGVGIEASHTNAKSKSKANAGAQSQKVIQWMYPRVTIWPRESLELSPSYLAAVKDALNEPDAELKAQKLLDIDSQYGDYYPFSVSLVRRAVLKNPVFFFVKDSPEGQPLRTDDRQPPPTATNRHQLPTAANHQPPTTTNQVVWQRLGRA